MRLIRRLRGPVDGELLSEAEFETPHGRILARPYEIYLGLKGQMRIGLVDQAGRVFHYDTSDVGPVGDPLIVTGRTRSMPTEVEIEFRKVAVA